MASDAEEATVEVSTQRDEVLVIVPPNSNTVIAGRWLTVTDPEEHSDWSDLLCLGALSLVSALKRVPGVKPIYVDGSTVALDEILVYLTDNAQRILAVCLGMLTDNYEAGLLIARHAKQADDRITTIAGNDHFTALPRTCLSAARCLDYGFVGNEIVGPFTDLVATLHAGASVVPSAVPGLAYRGAAGDVAVTSPHREPIFTDFDYGLVDRTFTHTEEYARQFRRRIAPRVLQLLGRHVHAGVPVEIGRGCVKFAGDDACSFCAIQPGQLWRNQLSPELSWAALRSAFDSGYDYLYLTADELPLTFATLLSGMAESAPDWWTALAEHDRPMLVGYGRADGIADARKTALLTSLGVRQIMIGMDAATPVSLAAMNKPLGGRHRDVLAEAELLYRRNAEAIRVARDHGLLIRAGFVVGHIGMTRQLLQENVERILALISEGAEHNVFAAIDAEVLQPLAGSRDYRYLIDPNTAKTVASSLGLKIADDATLMEVSRIWRDQDVVSPEEAMRDYTRALMPELSFDELAQARATIRSHAKRCAVVIGE
jgi:anaerobic magnesium-protoporphyrin IX monomethyl ester cyclase